MLYLKAQKTSPQTFFFCRDVVPNGTQFRKQNTFRSGQNMETKHR